MKTKFIVFAIIIGSTDNSFSQITFQKNASYWNTFSSVQQTLDSGYIICGAAMGIIKLNKYGDTLWTKNFGLSTDEAFSIQQTSDSGYIICGTQNYGQSNEQLYLIRTDINGNVLWNKTYLAGTTSRGNSVQQTSDGGFIAIGRNFGTIFNVIPLYLIKTDVNGDTIWTKMYFSSNSSYDSFNNSIVQTNDGGYIMTGEISPDIIAADLIYVYKIDAYGNTLWTKVLGDTLGGSSIGTSIQQTTDGGYIITGSENRYNAQKNNNVACLIKMDSIGNVLWAKNFLSLGFHSVECQGNSVEQTSDGGYIIAGESDAWTNDSGTFYHIYMIKTDSNGDTTWARTYTYLGAPANSIIQTLDGGYIVAASTSLIKTDNNGIGGCAPINNTTQISTLVLQNYSIPISIFSPNTIVNSPTISYGANSGITTYCFFDGIHEISVFKNFISIYPNPLTSSSTLQLTTQVTNAEVVIYDVLGKEMMRKKMDGDRMEITRSSLESGVYFVRLIDGDTQYVQKLVIQ